MRIACVDNISAAAYRATPPPFPVVWSNEPPVRTREAIVRGEVDAALVSVAALPTLVHTVRPIGPFGIASTGRVGSVLYIGDRSPQELVRDGKRVYISHQSLTARDLFPLLCRMSFGQTPLVTSERSEAAAQILIGNEALYAAHFEATDRVVLDLCEWWHRETNLPFVFAQWVVSITLPLRKRLMLRQWLDEATRFAESPSGRDEMEHEVSRLGIPGEAAARYYGGVQYRLTANHVLGMTAFLNLREEATRWTSTG